MQLHLFFSRHFFLATLTFLVVACASSSSSSPPPADNGVNDVAKACAIRDGWTQRQSNTCVECQSFAPIAKCNCPSFSNATYMGKCQAQGDAKAHEPDCNDTNLENCLHACKDEDCACIDGCYAGHDKCRAVAQAVDGCVAEVCDATCK